MKTIDILVPVLLVAGGLNWGLVGLFQFDLVAAIFGGEGAFLSRIIYTLIAASAVYQIVALKGIKKRWKTD